MPLKTAQIFIFKFWYTSKYTKTTAPRVDEAHDNNLTIINSRKKKLGFYILVKIIRKELSTICALASSRNTLSNCTGADVGLTVTQT
jgi:hypothetical protein